jgi:drug/metabolite transporter (DMT)-like permease
LERTILPYIGEILAIATAILWAFAVILLKKSGESVHPIALNTFKNILAAFLFIPTLYLFHIQLFRQAPFNEYLLILLSGALGIGLADTLFLMSLNRLGAGLSAIVDCLYSPFIIILSILYLGESMTLVQVLGVLLIISAVLFVTSPKASGHLTRKNLFFGIIYGAMAMAFTAVGIVMIKPLLDYSPILWVTEIRLFGGIVVLLAFLLLNPRRRIIMSSLFSIKSWKYTLSGSFIGTYLTMILWLGGMKFTQASIASALNQTSNIFIFVFAAVLLKEPINTQRVIAIIMGISGAFLVSFG